MGSMCDKSEPPIYRGTIDCTCHLHFENCCLLTGLLFRGYAVGMPADYSKWLGQYVPHLDLSPNKIFERMSSHCILCKRNLLFIVKHSVSMEQAAAQSPRNSESEWQLPTYRSWAVVSRLVDVVVQLRILTPGPEDYTSLIQAKSVA
jgi:hypothetical protein